MNDNNKNRSRFMRIFQSRPLRLSVSVVMLTVCVLMLANVLGVSERRDTGLRQARVSLAQSLAMQLSSMTTLGTTANMGEALKQLVNSNEDVIAASVNQPSTVTHVRVPVYKGDFLWGNVDVVYRPSRQLTHQLLWYAFVVIGCLLVFWLFFKRALMQLDPR